MKKSVKTLLVFGTFLFAITAATAQEGETKPRQKPSPEKMMAKLDTDQDGMLSREEVAAAKKGKLSERFDTVDGNEDGFLDIEELNIFHAKRKERKERNKE